ncbi:hypothetical protein QC764_203070 [Podospora pseudoanserina]|uniref:C2H2-type domain-containing protein n=1 Tax=Podospora pseudoanserina TaxID=2609844 RepID=A0ABR0IHJ8_9PEZI|nr:hypothetical protein QC764_203070 [Podospora pseudoanserina]
MSVVYEARNFMHESDYPPMDEHHHEHHEHHDAAAAAEVDRFAETHDAVVNELAHVASFAEQAAPFVDAKNFVDVTVSTEETPSLDLAPPAPAPTLAVKEDSPVATSPQRSKAIPKPHREETKNHEGKFICTYPSCGEETRTFSRKCEWNKHMDKHDRPYKCLALGCEKLPGFTYSGGLLRHEREVHQKHGGPKNSFNCPHQNCKRATGKGFSRQENLNEHLRRVHTQNGGSPEGDADDAASDHVSTALVLGPAKRKRDDQGDETERLREEIKRLRQEKEELQKQVQMQNQQTADFLARIHQLEAERAVAAAVPMEASSLVAATSQLI